MKMRRVGLWAFALTSIAALASANAADVYRAPEPFAGGYKDAPLGPGWAGFYAGAQVGWAGTDARLRFNNGAPTLDPSEDGVIGGGHAGYNFVRGPWVFGVEGDFEAANLSKHVSSAAGITSEGSLDNDWQASIRGRIGYATGRALVYGTGGAAFANINVKGGPLGGPLNSNSDTVTGWTAGGGVEYALSAPFSVRIEYRFADFGQQDFLLPTFGVHEKVDLKESTVRGGVSYHFGNAYEPLK
jgi:outer membrane immunogenic protein